MVDAFPNIVRRNVTILGVGYGIICLSGLMAGLIWRVISFHDYSLQLGRVKFSFSSFVSHCAFNWILFGIRNVVNAFVYPKNLVVIRSPIESGKVTQVEAKVMYAAFHLKEAAGCLKEENEEEGGVM